MEDYETFVETAKMNTEVHARPNKRQDALMLERK